MKITKYSNKGADIEDTAEWWLILAPRRLVLMGGCEGQLR